MIELKTIDVIEIVALFLMTFLLGVSLNRTEKIRKIAQILQLISLAVVWICIFIK